MSNRLFVKPDRPGAVVRDPHTRRALPPEGGRVPDTAYWRRRLRTGDVVFVEPARPTSTARVLPAQKVDQ